MPTTAEMRCARHPNEATAITCASCGTPICPKCMVSTPVGMKCPDCGRSKNMQLFQVKPGRLLLAGITALVAGAVASVIGLLGCFVVFISIPYGYFAGSMILRASGMKRGLKMEILAGAGMVIGALSLRILPALFLAKNAQAALSFALASLADPFFWLAVVIATACAVSKIRYL